jgi:hypothetical protein
VAEGGMMNVYIVTRGYYSEYHIVAVFDNEADATKLSEATSDSRVETHTINSISPVPPNMKFYRVEHIKADGAWKAMELYDIYDTRLAGRSDIYTAPDLKHDFATHCFAKDEQHAGKIGSERRAFMIANYGNDYSAHQF